MPSAHHFFPSNSRAALRRLHQASSGSSFESFVTVIHLLCLVPQLAAPRALQGLRSGATRRAPYTSPSEEGRLAVRRTLTPKPCCVGFPTQAVGRRRRPSTLAMSWRSPGQLPGCTGRGRPPVRRVQHRKPEVVAQLHELQHEPVPNRRDHRFASQVSVPASFSQSGAHCSLLLDGVAVLPCSVATGGFDNSSSTDHHFHYDSVPCDERSACRFHIKILTTGFKVCSALITPHAHHRSEHTGRTQHKHPREPTG